MVKKMSKSPEKKVAKNKSVNTRKVIKNKDELKFVPVQEIKSVKKTKKSIENKEIAEQEITELGGYIHGVYFSREVVERIADSTRRAINNCHNKLFAERLKEPSVIGYIEVLEHKLAQAERILQFKPKKSNKRK